MTNAIALLALSIVLVMSLWLIMSSCYRENWTQFIGLCLLVLASGARINDALSGRLSNEEVAFFVGAALFLVGLVAKILKYLKKEARV